MAGKYDTFAFMRAVRDDASLSSTQKHVALLLVTWADYRTGECHPEHAQIAEGSGYNVQTVRKTLTALVKCGRLGAQRTARPGGGTLIYYTLRVRPTDAQDTTVEHGSSDAYDTNGSGDPVMPSTPVDNRPSDALDTSDALGTTDALDTTGDEDPVMPRASMQGNYPENCFKNPLTTSTRGPRSAGKIRAEAATLDMGDRSGSDDARAVRAIEFLVEAEVEKAVADGTCRTRTGLAKHIRARRMSEDFPGALANARQGWTPRDIAARIENPSHRPQRRDGAA